MTDTTAQHVLARVEQVLGMYLVRCSCGYKTRPHAYPGPAERAAAEHKWAKENPR